jgi:hypothetical protein
MHISYSNYATLPLVNDNILHVPCFEHVDKVQSGFMPSHWISDHRKIMESIHNRQG